MGYPLKALKVRLVRESERQGEYQIKGLRKYI